MRCATLSIVHAWRTNITDMMLLFGLGDRSKDLVSHSVFRVNLSSCRPCSCLLGFGIISRYIVHVSVSQIVR